MDRRSKAMAAWVLRNGLLVFIAHDIDFSDQWVSQAARGTFRRLFFMFMLACMRFEPGLTDVVSLQVMFSFFITLVHIPVSDAIQAFAIL